MHPSIFEFISAVVATKKTKSNGYVFNTMDKNGNKAKNIPSNCSCVNCMLIFVRCSEFRESEVARSVLAVVKLLF